MPVSPKESLNGAAHEEAALASNEPRLPWEDARTPWTANTLCRSLHEQALEITQLVRTAVHGEQVFSPGVGSPGHNRESYKIYNKLPALCEAMVHWSEQGLRAGWFRETVGALAREDWNLIPRYALVRAVLASVFNGDQPEGTTRSRQDSGWENLTWLVQEAPDFWAAWAHANTGDDLYARMINDTADRARLGHNLGQLIAQTSRLPHWIDPVERLIGHVERAIGPQDAMGESGTQSALAFMGPSAKGALREAGAFDERHRGLFRACPADFWWPLAQDVSSDSSVGRWIVEQALELHKHRQEDAFLHQIAQLAWARLDQKALVSLETTCPGLVQEEIDAFCGSRQVPSLAPERFAALKWAKTIWTQQHLRVEWLKDSEPMRAWKQVGEEDKKALLHLLYAHLQRQALTSHLRAPSTVGKREKPRRGPVNATGHSPNAMAHRLPGHPSQSAPHEGPKVKPSTRRL